MPCSNIFPYISPKGKGNKGKNKQMGLHQIKNFYMAKEVIIKMKREPTVWENIFVNDTSDKGLSSKYMKNSYNSTPGRQTTKLRNGQRR